MHQSPCGGCWWCGSWPQPGLYPASSGGRGRRSWSRRDPWDSRGPQDSPPPDAPWQWSVWHHLGGGMQRFKGQMTSSAGNRQPLPHPASVLNPNPHPSPPGLRLMCSLCGLIWVMSCVATVALLLRGLSSTTWSLLVGDSTADGAQPAATRLRFRSQRGELETPRPKSWKQTENSHPEMTIFTGSNELKSAEFILLRWHLRGIKSQLAFTSNKSFLRRQKNHKFEHKIPLEASLVGHPVPL